MSNIEKFRWIIGISIIIFVVYDNYINKSASVLPPYGLIVIAGVYALIYYLSKLKKFCANFFINDKIIILRFEKFFFF